jgi:predicted dehydrogenase
MADKVDIGFIQSCNWDKHIDQAMPFIQKGKPVFIDKPIVGSMKDIERIEKLVGRRSKDI